MLEDLRSQFHSLGKLLGHVAERAEEHGERLTKIEAELIEIRAHLTSVETDLTVVKGEIAVIRHNQVTRDEFKLLESRVARLERSRK